MDDSLGDVKKATTTEPHISSGRRGLLANFTCQHIFYGEQGKRWGLVIPAFLTTPEGNFSALLVKIPSWCTSVDAMVYLGFVCTAEVK